MLMDWLGRMGEEYDNTNKDIWGDKLTTSVILEYCSEEMLVGGGREVGRRDDLSVLEGVSCQDNLFILEQSAMFPVSRKDWKKIFISGQAEAKVLEGGGDLISQCRDVARLMSKLAQACGVPVVGIRAVDCWQ